MVQMLFKIIYVMKIDHFSNLIWGSKSVQLNFIAAPWFCKQYNKTQLAETWTFRWVVMINVLSSENSHFYFAQSHFIKFSTQYLECKSAKAIDLY